MQHTRLSDPDRHVVETAYARWAPLYDKRMRADLRTGPAQRDRRARCGSADASSKSASVPGCRSATTMRRPRSSASMFPNRWWRRRAQRMASGLYPHVKAVMVMDAHELEFEDASFDCVVAQFVITLVADPERVLSECARVLRPGGEIILVNHLYSEHGMLAAIERWAARPSRALGLRPEFPFARLLAWAQGAWRRRIDRAPAPQAAAAPIPWYGSGAWLRAAQARSSADCKLGREILVDAAIGIACPAATSLQSQAVALSPLRATLPTWRARPSKLPTVRRCRRGRRAAQRRCAAYAADLLADARCAAPAVAFSSRPRRCSAPARSSSAAPTTSSARSPNEQRAGGVVAFSSGNHAQGVAAAAKLLGMPAVIVMPSDAPRAKRERTAALGAEVVLYDRGTRRPRGDRARHRRRTRAPCWCRPTTIR